MQICATSVCEKTRCPYQNIHTSQHSHVESLQMSLNYFTPPEWKRPPNCKSAVVDCLVYVRDVACKWKVGAVLITTNYY